MGTAAVLLHTFVTLFSTRKPLGSNTAMVEANNFIFQTRSFDALSEFALLISCTTHLAFSAVLSC